MDGKNKRIPGEKPSSLHSGESRPSGEGFSCHCHRPLHLLWARAGDRTHHASRPWGDVGRSADIVNRVASGSGNPVEGPAGAGVEGHGTGETGLEAGERGTEKEVGGRDSCGRPAARQL